MKSFDDMAIFFESTRFKIKGSNQPPTTKSKAATRIGHLKTNRFIYERHPKSSFSRQKLYTTILTYSTDII